LSKMKTILFLVGIATAVLCTTNAIPVENHYVASENLNDYLHYNAFADIQATRYKSQDGAFPEYWFNITGAYIDYQFVYIYGQTNANLVYSLDFTTSKIATKISLGLAAAYPEGVVTEINVYVDSPTSTSISTLYLTTTENVYNFANLTATVTNAPKGIHDVYFIFTASNPDTYCHFNWLAFY